MSDFGVGEPSGKRDEKSEDGKAKFLARCHGTVVGISRGARKV